MSHVYSSMHHVTIIIFPCTMYLIDGPIGNKMLIGWRYYLQSSKIMWKWLRSLISYHWQINFMVKSRYDSIFLSLRRHQCNLRYENLCYRKLCDELYLRDFYEFIVGLGLDTNTEAVVNRWFLDLAPDSTTAPSVGWWRHLQCIGVKPGGKGTFEQQLDLRVVRS